MNEQIINNEAQPTRITSASVRVSLSMNYNTFEVAMTIENEFGISEDEITEYRLRAQNLANEAVDDYKATQAIEHPERKVKKDNVTIEDIEALPLYSEIKKRQLEFKSTKNAKN